MRGLIVLVSLFGSAFTITFPTSGSGQAPGDSLHVLVAGRIVQPDRKPVDGAEVIHIGGSLLAMSTKDGEFRFRIARSVIPVVILVRRPGFKAEYLRLDGPWTGTIVLVPGAFPLPDLEVKARAAKPIRYSETHKYDEVFVRRRMGLGELIDREQIERRGASRVAQVLEGRAGMRVQVRPLGAVEGTIVAFTRCNDFPPRINVYLDGRKLQPEIGPLQRVMSSSSSAPRQYGGEDPQTWEARARVRAQVGEMLDRVSVSEIELIEVFRGVSELPAEFNDGNCGAIAIWSRQGGL